MRNGIAHGGITFFDTEVCYRDKKGNEDTFDAQSIVRLFDNLLDVCNGIAVALKIFLLTSRSSGYNLPREVFVEELQEETLCPWWRIEGCVESETVDQRSQLLIYAKPDSAFFEKVQWSAIQSGILAESFAPGYDRYFFSLKSKQSWQGFAGFDGKRLKQLREDGESDFLKYTGIVENGGIFYVVPLGLPQIFGKLETLVDSFQLQFPMAMKQWRKKSGVPEIICRNSLIHRNSWGSVIRGDVCIETCNEAGIIETIRSNPRRIIRTAIEFCRKENRWNGISYIPIGFVQVSVYRKDFRRRRLNGFGLGDDLICTVRFQRLDRLKSPDIVGATVETVGQYRIAWNKAWLKVSDI